MTAVCRVNVTAVIFSSSDPELVNNKVDQYLKKK